MYNLRTMAGFKAALSFSAKAAVSVGLLAWLLRNSDWKKLGTVLFGIDPGILILVLMANALFILIRAWRFSVILKDHARFSLPFPLLLRYYLISCFFGLFVPGGIAGDWVRTVKVNRHGRSLGFSLQSVFLERYLGLLALLAIASAFLNLPLSPVDLPYQGRMALSGAFLLGLIPPAVILFRSYRAFPIPATWKENLDRLTGRTLLKASGLSLALQAAGLLVFLLLALSMGMRIPLAILSPLVLASSLATLLPISIQGLGVNQTLFVHGLAAYGYAAETALLFSLSVFALDVFTGIIGGILHLVEKRD